MSKSKQDTVPIVITALVRGIVAKLSARHRAHARSVLVSSWKLGGMSTIERGEKFSYHGSWYSRPRPDKMMTWSGYVLVVTECSRGAVELPGTMNKTFQN